MTQHHLPWPAGRFAKCPKCGSEPRHIEHRGRTLAESMDFTIPARRQVLECACGRTTTRCATLAEAEAEWGVVDDQIPLTLPVNVTRIAHGRRKAKAVRS